MPKQSNLYVAGAAAEDPFSLMGLHYRAVPTIPSFSRNCESDSAICPEVDTAFISANWIP